MTGAGAFLNTQRRQNQRRNRQPRGGTRVRRGNEGQRRSRRIVVSPRARRRGAAAGQTSRRTARRVTRRVRRIRPWMLRNRNNDDDYNNDDETTTVPDFQTSELKAPLLNLSNDIKLFDSDAFVTCERLSKSSGCQSENGKDELKQVPEEDEEEFYDYGYDDEDYSDEEFESYEILKESIQKDFSFFPGKFRKEVSMPPIYVAYNDFLNQIRGECGPSYNRDALIIGDGVSIFGLPVLSPSSTFVTLMVTLILFIDLTYSSFLIPAEVAFDFFPESSRIWLGISSIATLFFIFQIILDFQIGFIHRHNIQKVLVMDGSIIAQKSLWSLNFLVDFISVIPFFLQAALFFLPCSNSQENYVDSKLQNLYTLVEILMLVRLFRVFRIIRRLFSQCYKTSSQLYMFIPSHLLIFIVFGYAAAVLFNIFSCLWYLAARIHGFADSWISARGIEDDGKVYQWLTAFYWATVTSTTIGYGDISATNAVEEAFAIFIMVMGVIFFAFIMAVATDLFQSATRGSLRAEKFRQKMVQIRAWMKDYRLPKKLQKEIAEYYGDEWLYNQDLNDANIFDELPELLAGKISIQMTQNFLPDLEIFEELDENEWKEIAVRLTPMTLLPGQDVFREPSLADAIYIIQEGEVQVTRFWQKVDHLVGPDFFAEVDILEGKSTEKVRWMSMICDTQCRIWRLDVLDLKTILLNMPRLTTQKIKNGIRRRVLRSAYDSISPDYFPNLLDRIEDRLDDSDVDEEEGGQQLQKGPQPRPQLPQIVKYWEAVADLPAEDEEAAADIEQVERELMESRIYGPVPTYL